MKSLIKAFKLGIICIMLSILRIIFVGETVWELKEKCNSTTNKYLQKMYVRLFEKKLRRFGSWIGYNAIIGAPPIFPHGMHGIFISGGTKIGKNCVIFQHVTIGSNTIRDSKGYGTPEIGNNVYIGAGAKIMGG